LLKKPIGLPDEEEEVVVVPAWLACCRVLWSFTSGGAVGLLDVGASLSLSRLRWWWSRLGVVGLVVVVWVVWFL